MKHEAKELHWIPLIALGPIKFNTPFSINSFRSFAVRDVSDLDCDWKTYSLDELQTYFHVEDGVVIDCDTGLSCIYKGTELIGMSVSDIFELFSDICVRDNSSDSLNYIQKDMDIIFWIENGIVDSVTVGGGIDQS